VKSDIDLILELRPLMEFCHAKGGHVHSTITATGEPMLRPLSQAHVLSDTVL